MFTPDSNIDTLYDYRQILKGEGELCKLPPEALGKEVAIVGGGAAGVLAAHELLKMGVKPTIYEFSSRLGGRLYSRPFEKILDDVQPFAELGAMRIPACSHIFFHYAKKLQLHFNELFPAPGNVRTTVYYQKKLHDWSPESAPPALLRKNKRLWDQFLEPYVRTIHEGWKSGNLEIVRGMWQFYISIFKNKTLYDVLLEQSSLSLPKNMEFFRALGLGAVGLQPLLQVCFLNILRVLINTCDKNQKFIEEGVSQFVEGLYRLKVNTAEGKTLSLMEEHCAQLNTTVVGIDYNPQTKNPILIYRDPHGERFEKEVGAVIYTGSTSAAHLLGLSSKTRSGFYLFSDHVREATKSSPMFFASKTYICTETKFWKELNLPTYIVTDEITQNTIFLDYPKTKRGVVCLSYSYGMDALKLTAVDPEHRVIIFKRIIQEISGIADRHLNPLNHEILNVDWITEKFQNGSFKLSLPGSDRDQHALYYQFQSVLSPEDKGVYLAGDSVSWMGGWVEGALSTSLNAVYAVAKRFGGNVGKHSPLSQNPKMYTY